MSAAGELLQVRATLGQHRGGGLGANAGDGLQELVGLAQIRARDAAGDFLIRASISSARKAMCRRARVIRNRCESRI